MSNDALRPRDTNRVGCQQHPGGAVSVLPNDVSSMPANAKPADNNNSNNNSNSNSNSSRGRGRGERREHVRVALTRIGSISPIWIAGS